MERQIEAFTRTLSETQAASLRALLSFGGTTNQLRKALHAEAVHNEYLTKLSTMLWERGYTIEEIKEQITQECGL